MSLLFFGSETTLLSWLSFLDFNPISAGNGYCVAPFSPMARLLMGLYMPLLSIVLLWITFMFRWLLIAIFSLSCCLNLNSCCQSHCPRICHDCFCMSCARCCCLT